MMRCISSSDQEEKRTDQGGRRGLIYVVTSAPEMPRWRVCVNRGGIQGSVERSSMRRWKGSDLSREAGTLSPKECRDQDNYN